MGQYIFNIIYLPIFVSTIFISVLYFSKNSYKIYNLKLTTLLGVCIIINNHIVGE